MGGERITIEALQGAISPGLTQKDLEELYREFTRYLMVKVMRREGLIMEIALNVAGHAIKLMGIAGKAASRKEDEYGAYIEGFLPVFSERVAARIRESGTMNAPVVFSIVTPGREVFRWVPPSLASQLERLPVLATPPQTRPTAPPKAAATPVSDPTKTWGPPGPGGVDLKYLTTQYSRLKRIVYGGQVPKDSAVAVISWTVAATLMKDRLPFRPDPKGRPHFVARVQLGGENEEVDIRLIKDLLPEGNKIGFMIRNIPGQPAEMSEWWWPGVKLEEVAGGLTKSAQKATTHVKTRVRDKAVGLASHLKRGR